MNTCNVWIWHSENNTSPSLHVHNNLCLLALSVDQFYSVNEWPWPYPSDLLLNTLHAYGITSGHINAEMWCNASRMSVMLSDAIDIVHVHQNEVTLGKLTSTTLSSWNTPCFFAHHQP